MVFADEFRVEKPLSAGGMGAVYVVTQLATQRQRALKVMHPELANDPKFRARFQQEAQVGARIQSEHIIEVVDAGVDTATNMPYLAMELLAGADLADTVAHQGPLASEQVASIYDQLCHALAAAHRVGVVHRDLKPENLFLATSRRADSASTLKILDFGIAKMLAEAQTARAHTQTIGSPLWMAPEQTVSGHRITTQTDVWALGLIAFYLLTGRPYWRAANTETQEQMALLREIAFEPLVAASVRARELGVEHLLPPDFDGWFARCVVRDAAQRFANVEMLHAELYALLRRSPSQPQVPAPAATVPAIPMSADIPTDMVAPHLVSGTSAAGATEPQQPNLAPPAGAHTPLPPTQPYTQPAHPLPLPDSPHPPATPGVGPTAPMDPPPPHPTTASLATPPTAPMARPTASRRTMLWVAAAFGTLGIGVGIAMLMSNGDPHVDESAEGATTTAQADAPDGDPDRAPNATDSATARATLVPSPAEPSAAAEPSASGQASASADTPPSASARARVPARPPTKPTWSRPKSTQTTAVKPIPKPAPKPTARPTPRPAPRPTVKPPSPYGRRCRKRSDCGPGYDCSYGGKCVPL